MNFKKIEQFAIFSLSAFTMTFFGACSVKNADEDITIPCYDCENKEKPQEQERSVAELEMEDTYYLLSVYYLAANEKLDSISSYIGHGEAAGFSPDRYEYPDVYYMYSQMGDNRTRYLGPYYASKYNFDETTDPILNLAVETQSVNSRLVISQVYPGGPGDKAGLKVGDTILFIGSSAPGDIDGFQKLTSGNEGDSLSLKVLRGADSLDISATLYCYLEPTVFVTYHDSIPVIKMTGFEEYSAIRCTDVSNANNTTAGTTAELKNILQATKGAAVIDLRGNPGGSTDQCIQASELFLSKGDSIVIMEYTDIAPDSVHQVILKDVFVASNDGVGKGRYIVFLADSNSASCSEILLASTTANLKSPIVGTQTLGKGIGQYYVPTYAGGYSIITAMRVFDKNNGSFHDKGFLPDYAIADTTKALEKALELAKAGTEKRAKGYGTERLHHFDDPFAKKASINNGLPKGGAYKIVKNPRMK